MGKLSDFTKGHILACVELQWLKDSLHDQEAKADTISHIDTISQVLDCSKVRSEHPKLWNMYTEQHTSFVNRIAK